MVNTGPFAECARRSRTARAGSSAAVRPVRAHRMGPQFGPPTGASKGVAKRVARPGGPHGHPSLGARIIARLGLPPARARLGHSACAHWGRDVEGSPRQAGQRHRGCPGGSAMAPDAPPLGALSRPRRRTVMTKNRGNDSSLLAPKGAPGPKARALPCAAWWSPWSAGCWPRPASSFPSPSSPACPPRRQPPNRAPLRSAP